MRTRKGCSTLTAWCKRPARCRAHAPIGSPSSDTHAAAAASLQYILAIGNVQAVILHDAGYALRPVIRAAEFKTPILIMHGTADGPAGGGSANTDVALARDFEAALRRNGKSVEANYYEGGGHNTFFINSTQRDDEVKRMIASFGGILGRNSRQGAANLSVVHPHGSTYQFYLAVPPLAAPCRPIWNVKRYYVARRKAECSVHCLRVPNAT